MAITRVLFALAAAAWLAPLHGQAIYKCVGKDGKTSYSNAPCAGAKRMPGGSAAPSGAAGAGAAEADVSRLPALQHGKWAWVGLEGDACGDPLERFRRAISSAYTNAARMGCTARLVANGPGNTLFVMDCPADGAEGGVNFRKGKTEISVYSASPGTVRVSTQGPGKPLEVFEATRVGDC